VLTFAGGSETFLPTGQAITAGELLSSYVELSTVAGRRQIGLLADSTACLASARPGTKIAVSIVSL